MHGLEQKLKWWNIIQNSYNQGSTSKEGGGWGENTINMLSNKQNDDSPEHDRFDEQCESVDINCTHCEASPTIQNIASALQDYSVECITQHAGEGD